MSDDVIKVHDLPGIAQYSESIKQFSQSLTTATQDTARTFNVKIEGSEGEAIAAFLGQLNTLQNQVFNQIPAFLNKYSANVGKFSSAVSGGGFTKEAWTSESGLLTVQSKLTGEQVDKVSEVDQKLQSALNIATDALDEPEISISSVKSGAILSLNASSLTRQATHEPFQLAHELFNKDLQTTIEEVSALRGIVNQAQITLNLTPKAVFNMITQGLKMNPIDTVQNIDEAIALDAVYGDDQTKISKVNRKNVRNEVVFHMVDGMTTWVLKKDTNKLGTFYDEFGRMELADSHAWLDLFATAGKDLAINHQKKMIEKFEEVNGNYKQMDAEFDKENAINEILGINRGLYAINFGKGTYKPNGSNISVDDPKQISFKFDEDGTTRFNIIGQASGYNMKGFQSSSDEYTSDFSVDSRGNNKKGILDKLNEIGLKKQSIIYETLRDVFVEVGGKSAPQYKVGFKLFKAFGGHADDVIGIKSPEGGAVLKGARDWGDTRTEEEKEVANLKRLLVDKGSWHFKGGTGFGEQNINSDDTYYRFEVTQRISELDKYGTKLFLNQEGIDPNEYYAKMKDKGINEETRNYLIGKKSNLKFESMDQEQILELNRGLEVLDNVKKKEWDKDDGSSFTKYLATKYERHEIK